MENLDKLVAELRKRAKRAEKRYEQAIDEATAAEEATPMRSAVLRDPSIKYEYMLARKRCSIASIACIDAALDLDYSTALRLLAEGLIYSKQHAVEYSANTEHVYTLRQGRNRDGVLDKAEQELLAALAEER